ncbi:MAG: type II toxin-antitoxin system VapC family toxin [Fidelibacterota bacterium]
MKYLLDTCVLSEFTRPAPSQTVLDFIGQKKEIDLFISTMTLAELHRGVIKLQSGKTKNSLLQWLDDIEQNFQGRILSFDHNSAIERAKISVNAEQRGKKLSAFDSIIAAIAGSNHLTLVTRNIKDFENTDLELINP